jgi:hypothetical protein
LLVYLLVSAKYQQKKYQQSRYKSGGTAAMPRQNVPLTDVQVNKAKRKEKDYKLSDGGGLHLLVTKTGGKLWRLQYRFDGKQKMLAFGA